MTHHDSLEPEDAAGPAAPFVLLSSLTGLILMATLAATIGPALFARGSADRPALLETPQPRSPADARRPLTAVIYLVSGRDEAADLTRALIDWEQEIRDRGLQKVDLTRLVISRPADEVIDPSTLALLALPSTQGSAAPNYQVIDLRH